jgi:ribosomal protein L11 methyltransferase
LWVRPVWEPAVEGRVEVIIDPTRAFGAGFHPTTSACMAELDRALGDRTGVSVLDVGTGTGILAIAAAHLGAEVVGVEIDAVACIDAERNAALNGVSERIRVRHGSLELLADPTHGLPPSYELVVANVLGPILVKLAPAIIPACDARLILSGIMLEREPEVIAAYPGFGLVARVEVRGWVTLHLQRI